MSIKTKEVKSFLNPDVIAKIENLELRARMIVEGFMIGLHRSPYHGFSVEFSEHRPYMQGDSLKNLDWKVYAKSEKFFIKQYEEETNLICHIFLDVSSSMNFKYSSRITKFDYAITLAAALSYIMINQQDAVGLAIYSDHLHSYLPPKSNIVYLKTLFTELANTIPSGNTNTSNCIDSIINKINKRGLTIIISDFFDFPSKSENDIVDSIMTTLKHIHYKKNEIIVFQILDPIEMNFGFDRDSIFIDLETKDEITTQPYLIQKAYQDAMKDFLNRLKTECLNYGIQYNLIETTTPFDRALLNYFSKRAKLY
ncbi:MAG: DUF58 domain-containing protein [Melioribacter sp.]|uniref:DUF58 domain-containing protein n=1 Tax=Rosettibacter primus TaxID=3111523 RepID=UPI00247B5323|nr:DUF58 domain-containing protein [Melioribacter sp.]